MNPADHAAMLRQTAALMEEAARAVERVGVLEARLKKASESLNGEVDRRLMMERRIAGLLPPPADGDFRPQFDRLLERLERANEITSAWDEMVRENATVKDDHHAMWNRVRLLESENEKLKGKNTSLGNHAICRLNLLGDIYRVLGSDGGETGVNMLTGVSPELDRLPKRIERLIRENETLARNVPPEPPSVATCEAPCVISTLIGQQWCRLGSQVTLPQEAVYVVYPKSPILLCNVYRNPDGSLTYEPVRISDLPEFQP